MNGSELKGEARGQLLVVDDNEANRDMLARRLRRQGYTVDAAEDGPEALRKIDASLPDLVLLDVMMPGMSGIDVLRHLRDRYDRAELPVLMATAKTDSEDVVEALALGANDYITKPIDFPVLLARVASHLQTRLQASHVPPASTRLPADGEAPPGTVLDGRFRVERTLGVGGFAIVFLATQLSTGQLVAVKVLRSHFGGDSEERSYEHKRFETEMRLIGRLRHPHVVRLVDYGILAASVETADSWSESSEPGISLEELRALDEANQLQQAEEASSEPPGSSSGWRRLRKRLPYIVMEYLEGEPLDGYLKAHGHLEAASAVELILPVASAVCEAHRLGIVHRDLKPQNVIVGRGQRNSMHPWVLDFGIARPDEEDSMHRGDDGLLGTPEYMAPEQARGAPADEKSDQYSVATLLYEMLTGRRPFVERSMADLVRKLAAGKFPRPQVLQPSIPDGLERVLLRAMDPLPERRFSSVDVFAKALLPFAPETIRARWKSIFAVQSDPPPPHGKTTVRPPSSSSKLAPVRPVVPQSGRGATTPSAMGDARAMRMRRAALSLGVVGLLLMLAALWIAFGR